MASGVHRVPGKRKGSVYFTDDTGFMYVKERKNKNGTTALKCASKGCKRRGVMSADEEELKHTSPHSGLICSNECHDVLSLRHNIRQRCSKEVTPLSVIFNEECAKFPAEVAARVPFASLERTLRRDQHSVHPGCPATITEYGKMIQEHNQKYGMLEGEPFFQAVLGCEANETAIFLPVGLINHLKEAEELHMDGTFKILPRKPKCYQLFTISFILHDVAIPAVFCIMSSKTAASYKIVFEWIKSFTGGLKVNTIMSDFESGIKAAVKHSFVGVKHIGCTKYVVGRSERSREISVDVDEQENDGGDEEEDLVMLDEDIEVQTTRRTSYGRYEDESVVLRVDSIGDLPSSEFVGTQIDRLSRSLGDEVPLVPTTDSSQLCPVCIEYKISIAFACGHGACYACSKKCLTIPRYFEVTTADGSTEETGVRLPVTCFTCRAILYKFMRLFF